MLIRYHAQRKHVMSSLDSLLYELHALSFLLSPSIFVLLCRCITQFQFARVRELDGRRSLRFWFTLVGLVNVSAVWAHAFGDAAVGAGNERSMMLDFVGMGYKSAKYQLLLLDATIMFLQAILTAISYETSLTLAMPADFEDPLLPSSPSPSPTSSTIADLSAEETAPFLPYTLPDTPSSSITYPPTPLLPVPSTSSSSALPRSPNDQADQQQALDDSTKQRPSDPLPPQTPIVDLSLRHIIHRLTSPIPEPAAGTGAGVLGTEGLDGGDDELAMLQLPLPNTTSVRVAHTLRIMAQARHRQRQRNSEQQREARRLRRGNETGSTAEGEQRSRRRSLNDGGGGGESEGTGAAREERPRGARIPGAIEDEDDV